MPIQVSALTVTMTDAEFALLNEGVAAPTIDPRGQFAALISISGAPITAVSVSGTTTVTLAAGNRTDVNGRVLLQRLRRAAQALRITFTP
jgi:DNA-binding IclR family transcriptional regulator